MAICKKIFLLLFVILSENLFSQDLKAGEMTVKAIGPNLYHATLNFYYKASVFVNRPYLLMDWGDGTLDTIQWDLITVGGCGDSDTFKKVFQKDHIYASDDTYLISCVDSFRVNSINNITNSNLEKFSLQYNLVINSAYAANQSPSSLNCLMDTWTGTSWVYNSGAFDSDGDSLSYSIVSPQNLTNYTFPTYAINNLSGDLTLSPTSTGKYALCMKIDEWKILSSTTTRTYFGSSYRNMLINVNSLAGINESHVNNESLNIYPNPSTDQITIEFDASAPLSMTSLEIKNVLGQTIKTISNTFSKGINKIEMDVSGFSKGLYFVQVQNGNKLINQKFIKE